MRIFARGATLSVLFGAGLGACANHSRAPLATTASAAAVSKGEDPSEEDPGEPANGHEAGAEEEEAWVPPDGSAIEQAAAPRQQGKYVVPRLPIQTFPFVRQDLYGNAWRPLEADGYLYWDGPPIPPFVPLSVDGADMLTHVSSQPDGTVLAMYRGACGYPHSCPLVALFGPTGERLWAFLPQDYFAIKDAIQVRGLAARDGVVFFNDSCNAYPKDQQRNCSSVLAVRGATGEKLWRSRTVVSNNQIHATKFGLLTAFGFTSNPDFLYLLDFESGRVLHEASVNGTPHHLIPMGDGTFELETNHEIYTVAVEEGKIEATSRGPSG